MNDGGEIGDLWIALTIMAILGDIGILLGDLVRIDPADRLPASQSHKSAEANQLSDLP